MRYHACWTRKKRPEAISPCGYEKNREDPACRDCADNPMTKRRIEIDLSIAKIAKKWAARWGI